jgi:hypothetical protein
MSVVDARSDYPCLDAGIELFAYICSVSYEMQLPRHKHTETTDYAFEDLVVTDPWFACRSNTLAYGIVNCQS